MFELLLDVMDRTCEIPTQNAPSPQALRARLRSHRPSGTFFGLIALHLRLALHKTGLAGLIVWKARCALILGIRRFCLKCRNHCPNDCDKNYGSPDRKRRRVTVLLQVPFVSRIQPRSDIADASEGMDR